MDKIVLALQKSQEDKSVAGASHRQVPEILLEAPEPESLPHKSHTRRYTKARGLDEHLVALHDVNAPATEQYRRLFVEIIRAGKQRELRTLLISSALSGEGKTTTALNLALTIAASGAQRVLLVEMDFRRPNIHSLLGTRPTYGLADYLLGEVEYSKLLMETQVPGLTVVYAGRPVSSPTTLLRSERMGQFFQKVQSTSGFPYVILDSSPLLLTSEPSTLIQYADATILVVHARKTPRDVVVKAVEIVKGENILGCVFNGIRPSDTNYYYYYYSSEYSYNRNTLY